MNAQGPRHALGPEGEALAAEYLREKGFRILARNYRTAWGEIDIIARDGGTYCFVEVKARRHIRQGTPFEAVTPAKQRKLYKMALTYLQEKDLGDQPARFDVVAVLFPPGEPPRLELLTNAFEVAG